jgi:excisionase family DNA binding protein
MSKTPKTFEEAITSANFRSEDYCGTSYAAKLLGLSVATVQSLVEKGEIEAWKTLGGHRRIALHSINTYHEKSNKKTIRVQSGSGSRLRVMVVEDDESARELYRCNFEAWDLRIDCTWMPSAIEAMMDIASVRPDLLITDLSMPGLDGLEMLKALKRNVHLADMHIVVVSGLSPQAVEARGGFPVYAHLLGKPINFDWLQGFMTALIPANVRWRTRDPEPTRRVSRTVRAQPAVIPPQNTDAMPE